MCALSAIQDAKFALGQIVVMNAIPNLRFMVITVVGKTA
jgi:hypothetical protein